MIRRSTWVFLRKRAFCPWLLRITGWNKEQISRKKVVTCKCTGKYVLNQMDTCFLCRYQARISLGTTEENLKIWFVYFCIFQYPFVTFLEYSFIQICVAKRYCTSVWVWWLSEADLRLHFCCEDQSPTFLSAPCCFPCVIRWVASAGKFVWKLILPTKTCECLALSQIIEQIWLVPYSLQHRGKARESMASLTEGGHQAMRWWYRLLSA